MFCEGLVQMQPETNGMPGEWVKEITGTCILRLVVETYSLDFIKKTIMINEFSDVHMDGHNCLVLRPCLFFHNSIYEDYSYLHEFPWRKWPLCSSEKQKRVLCIRSPLKHLSLPSATTSVMSSSSRQTFWYITKVTAATKGIILHMQYGDFIKGEHSPI